jgi:hypothetical protein
MGAAARRLAGHKEGTASWLNKYVRNTTRRAGNCDEPFRLADILCDCVDRRRDHAGDRCDLGIRVQRLDPQWPARCAPGAQPHTTYGWIWLITGVILIAAGALVLGPGDRPGAEISRWVGIVAASLGAISAIFVMPYYPVWALVYIAIAIMVIYGLSAHYGEQTA